MWNCIVIYKTSSFLYIYTFFKFRHLPRYTNKIDSSF